MSRKKDILTALRDLNDQDLRTAGAALFDALGYRSTRTFEDLPTDPTSFWDFFSQGHSDLDPGKAEIERWRGATFLFQLTDAEVHDLAQAREATKEQGDYEESEIESFLFLAIDLEGEQWTRTRLAQITRTLNRLFLMPAIVLFRHGGMASLAVIDRRQSKVDAAKDVILAKKIAIIKDIRLAKPHRAHIDILEKLTFANLNRGRNITTFRALYDAWLAACSVETLTKEFFTKLSELFFDTSDSVATRFPDENERRLFVQTLFNRLIFLRFVEEKGWMKIDGRYDYLQALWEKACDSNQPLWPTRLNALFGAVNHPISDKVHEVAKPIIGTVPYLNGGLFEDDSRFADPTVQFPDVIFDRLVGPEGLLYRYLFTVEESTPLDVQVAVDPEILGKIFEQLTISSKRHDTGSYYTPREIVQFMCREALVGYLTSPRPSGGEGSGVRGLPEAKARALVYDHDDSTLTNQEGNLAFEALKAIKVVDPACGSGAYLLGMLQELYALFEKLRRDDRKFSDDPAKEAHDRKLWIIENNIYGVDLQAFATNTAMLRLWLTLLVEDTGERPQPLPNLEYKIETGDSLLGPDPSIPVTAQQTRVRKSGGKGVAIGTQYDMDVERDDAIAELRNLREQYQNAHGPSKKEIKDQLDKKLDDLREKVTGSPKKDPAKFDWRVEFFDVFLGQDGSGVPPDSGSNRRDGETTLPGFDVVLANPPYVRHELITAIKPDLKRVFGEFYCGTADLYTFFYARAHQLLRPGGMLAFISSNKWFRAAYGANLRKLMADQTKVRSITDFGELPVFLTAATFPMIFVTQKGGSGVPPDRSANDRRDGETTLVRRQGYFLPHWTQDGAIYHVVFRLRDSLPQEVQKGFEEERDRLLRQPNLSSEEKRRLEHLVSDQVERYLDAGHGSCYMKQPAFADIVAEAIRHFDGDRYRLHAWAVMPNHVHAVVEPLPQNELAKILHSWKSFTAHEINKVLGREGEVWQKESYDHIVRNEGSYAKVVQYVLDNPVKAGLKNWKWSGSGGGSGVPPDSEHPRDAETTLLHRRDGETTFTQVKTLDPPYPDVAAIIAQSGFALPPNALNGAEWRLVDAKTAARMRRMEASGVPLGEYVKGKIYRGILTGFNEAFVIDGAKRAALIAEDPRSAEIIKPLAVGDDVRKWRIRKRDVWLIFTRRGVDLDRYPAIKRHLMRWRTELEPRPRDWKPSKPGEEWPGRKPGTYKWYEIQDDIAYYSEFDKPKIVFPDIAKESRFAFDTECTFCTNTTYMLPGSSAFLAGVLNSASMWWYCGEKLTVIGDVAERGRLRFFSQFVELLPIPRASDADRAAIESLVQQILDLKGGSGVPPVPRADHDPRDAETTLEAAISALEAEIDAIVERLYLGGGDKG
ncbi:MAG: hypothetical protein HND43_10275 [Armatimonadetes bacterium]|nr:hypothetical protein [Armatimonadota bacterium]NOG39762.1 hypothetical protein [Armatimonadota bacterium]GIK33384.1 MAG: hypothetical protein BroJett009_23760 [Armatimonadota bacterium]